jgi:hypothetical protein
LELPGFSAEASLHRTSELYHLIADSGPSTTQVVPSAGHGCIDCDLVCAPCDRCLEKASNPENCSYLCNDCYSCDCPMPEDFETVSAE